MAATSDDAALVAVLRASRRAGHLGPTPVEQQIDHALAYAAAVDATVPARAADLGAGGGVPGLVLAALAWPTTQWTLVEARQRRAAFLQEAVEELGLSARMRVVVERAEELGRSSEHRGVYDLVTARSFASPGVTAECGAPLLGENGLLVVSEPPGGSDEERALRWPVASLAAVGLTAPRFFAGPPRFAVVQRTGVVPERFPRRAPRLVKKPLF